MTFLDHPNMFHCDCIMDHKNYSSTLGFRTFPNRRHQNKQEKQTESSKLLHTSTTPDFKICTHPTLIEFSFKIIVSPTVIEKWTPRSSSFFKAVLVFSLLHISWNNYQTTAHSNKIILLFFMMPVVLFCLFLTKFFLVTIKWATLWSDLPLCTFLLSDASQGLTKLIHTHESLPLTKKIDISKYSRRYHKKKFNTK